MVWDILLGALGAILLLALLSFTITGLADCYQHLFEKRLKDRISRPDLIPAFSRFAAVATVALFLALAIGLRMATPG